MCEKNNTSALVFHIAIISFCSLGGVAEVAQRNLSAKGNPGFISIDCGATAEYLDNGDQIWYQTDDGYIDFGENMEAAPERMSLIPSDYQRMAKTIRSFPYGMRNCYILRPEKGENQTYLIRALFFYGNYDGKNEIPTFDLHVGVNQMFTVQLAPYRPAGFYEIYIAPPRGDVQVCLVNTGYGTPFINALELRILENALYQPGSTALRTWWIYDVGTDLPFLRYPDDGYDRIWKADEFNWLPISNDSIFNTNGTSGFYKIPNKVLMTAAGSPNTSTPLHYSGYQIDVANAKWRMYFHFAEIQHHQDGRKRVLRVSANNGTTKPITLEYAKATTIALPLYGNQVNFSIYADEGSNLPPIVNAIELFQVIDLPNTPTFSSDVDAITNVKQRYDVPKHWQGDPCVPKNYSWESINCSYINPPRIISLNLSFCNLMGEISSSFSKLDGIQTLDLSYNRLSGYLPEFLGELPNLKVLYLMGNNLTGPIPSSLKRKFQDGVLILRLEGNPLCQADYCEENKKSTEQRSMVPLIASISSAVVILVIVCALLFLWRIKRREDEVKNNQGLIELRNRPFRYNEILQITGNLRTVIGKGGFGEVYLGILTNGTKVAVKVLSKTSIQGHKEFQAEAQLLMIVHHKNLVSLIGYCRDGDNMALIYEYMINGNLRQHLSGLEYLHNGCRPPIVHRDLKPANILLDENMQAKIADFGLSKTFLTESASHVTTRVAGTIGYVDPEFQATGYLSKASDVYSFGIILFEIITGRSAIIRGSRQGISIVDWVNPLINGGDIRKVIDPTLHGDFEINSAWRAIEIAMSCTLTPGIQRPDMSIVLAELKQCLAVQMASGNHNGVRSNPTHSSFTGGGACLDSESFNLVSAR